MTERWVSEDIVKDASGGYMNWTTLVDGSAVSGRAFDAMIYFARSMNGRKGTPFAVQDRATVMHAYKKSEEDKKPYHLQSARLLNQYETNLIRGRRIYDSAGPQRLVTQVMSTEYWDRNDAKEEELSHLTFERNPGTIETAPPVVASLILKMRTHVRPDFLFVGSFGTGSSSSARKIGSNGSVTDYIIRLAPCSVFIIKNWRTVPKEHEAATYVVCLDGGEAAYAGLEQALLLARNGDVIHGITIGHGDESDIHKNVRKTSTDMANQTGTRATFSFQYKQMAQEAGPVGEFICHSCDELEADFVVIGTKHLAPGERERSVMPPMGSVALYTSQNSKCHAIVVKPPIYHDWMRGKQ